MSSLKERIDSQEYAVISRLVNRALNFGWVVSVSDGEEVVVHKAKTLQQIYAEIAHTDATYLKFYQDDKYFGTVMLVHGNGEDVISDHTDNEHMVELCNV
jgi:hypothetical protein